RPASPPRRRRSRRAASQRLRPARASPCWPRPSTSRSTRARGRARWWRSTWTATASRRDVMMSIAEAESMGRPIGKAKNASKDFRPSRMVKGTSRAAKLARRGGGAINDTTHRDAVRLQKLRGGTAAAARERVRPEPRGPHDPGRTWRAYHKYCEDRQRRVGFHHTQVRQLDTESLE
ncbi:unnamed protein product, partial [Prorocentrum cordatum]